MGLPRETYDHARRENVGKGWGNASMKILVLDDHHAYRKEVVAMLNRCGHEAHEVARAASAVPLAENGDYDLVLVDFNMPDHDGLWFMRNTKLPPRTKALLVTAHANRYVINQMFQSGVAGYIIKPFDETELIRHLEFHFGRGDAGTSGSSTQAGYEGNVPSERQGRPGDGVLPRVQRKRDCGHDVKKVE
jgi:two-component system, chemotaxis family, chemotaxis protein CheY